MRHPSPARCPLARWEARLRAALAAGEGPRDIIRLSLATVRELRRILREAGTPLALREAVACALENVHGSRLEGTAEDRERTVRLLLTALERAGVRAAPIRKDRLSVKSDRRPVVGVFSPRSAGGPDDAA